MLKHAFQFVSSLRLTVVLLTLSMVLVFIGTLAQVKLGLWEAQKHYFHSMFVMWGPAGAEWKAPVFPGGYLLGWALLVNLVAAHITRFKFSKKKIGIFLTHAGLIMLLLGQFFTELFQVESNMRIEEGQTKSYSESTRRFELAVADVTDPKTDSVVAIPDAILDDKGEIKHPKLPFTLRIKEYFSNSDPKLVAPVAEPNALRGTHGVGTRITFTGRPITTKMDEMNFPAAQIEVVGKGGVESTWMVSSWLALEGTVQAIKRQWGQMIGDVLDKPQQFTHDGRTFEVSLRPTRYYKFTDKEGQPFSITLQEFRHDVYKGTEIPKNFSSLVRVQNPATGEDREVLIYMNKPLRYGGETFYQGGFDPDNPRRVREVSILQVVRNPVWLSPYISCTIVGLGLVVQFLSHLVGFARKTSAQSGASRPGSGATTEAHRGGRSRKKPAATVAGAIPRTAERRSS